jgi:hypothetical protein
MGSPGSLPVCYWTDDIHRSASHLLISFAPIANAASLIGSLPDPRYQETETDYYNQH